MLSVRLTVTTHIPQEPVHVLRVFCTNRHCQAVLCFPRSRPQRVMTQPPALIRETRYWAYQAFSTPSHNPARGKGAWGRCQQEESPGRSHPPAQGRAWGLCTERKGIWISTEGWGRQGHTLYDLAPLRVLILKSQQSRRKLRQCNNSFHGVFDLNAAHKAKVA